MDIKRIQSCIDESAEAITALTDHADTVSQICKTIVSALMDGKKVLTAGNGGSSAEALHMAEELIGRFRGDRAALPGISLAADSTALTCIANDYGYESIFSRQVEGLGRDGDVLVIFSTSGNGMSLKLAVEAAKARNVKVVGLLGRDGGDIAGMSDIELLAPGKCTERIQEVHQLVLHIVLDAVETAFI